MSEITEIEIKSMSKEQNYMRGYEDGKSDVFKKIREEIQENINYNKRMNYQGIVAGLLLTLDIIDKYQTLDSINKYRNEVNE